MYLCGFFKGFFIVKIIKIVFLNTDWINLKFRRQVHQAYNVVDYKYCYDNFVTYKL
jgi:hypothetical protein